MRILLYCSKELINMNMLNSKMLRINSPARVGLFPTLNKLFGIFFKKTPEQTKMEVNKSKYVKLIEKLIYSIPFFPFRLIVMMSTPWRPPNAKKEVPDAKNERKIFDSWKTKFEDKFCKKR